MFQLHSPLDISIGILEFLSLRMCTASWTWTWNTLSRAHSLSASDLLTSIPAWIITRNESREQEQNESRSMRNYPLSFPSSFCLIRSCGWEKSRQCMLEARNNTQAVCLHRHCFDWDIRLLNDSWTRSECSASYCYSNVSLTSTSTPLGAPLRPNRSHWRMHRTLSVCQPYKNINLLQDFLFVQFISSQQLRLDRSLWHECFHLYLTGWKLRLYENTTTEPDHCHLTGCWRSLCRCCGSNHFSFHFLSCAIYTALSRFH